MAWTMSRLVAAMKPDVDAQFLRAADARERAVLQKPQQLGLQRPAHVGDLVQENRAAVGLLHAPGLLLERAGERAFLVAEQFAFEQRFRDRGAVDADVWRPAPLAQAVQRAGDQFLAGAAFAQNQRARVRGRDGLDQLPQLAHLRRVARRSDRVDRFHWRGRAAGRSPTTAGGARRSARRRGAVPPARTAWPDNPSRRP